MPKWFCLEPALIVRIPMAKTKRFIKNTAMDENVPIKKIGINNRKATEKGEISLIGDDFNLSYKNIMANTDKMMVMINSGATIISFRNISFLMRCSQNSLKLKINKMTTLPKLPNRVKSFFVVSRLYPI